jgi:hypothetical protein
MVPSSSAALRRATRLRVLLLCLLASAALWVSLVAAEHSYRERTFALIERNLYVGPIVEVPPPGTDVVVNLCEVDDPYRCEVHLWKPIRNGEPSPPMAWLRTQVDFLEAQHREGKTIFVHCLGGHSRSVLVVAAYLMHRHGWSRDRALEYIRVRHPMAAPHRVFMDSLLEWEQTLNGSADVEHFDE